MERSYPIPPLVLLNSLDARDQTEALVRVGRVASPFGVKGWAKINPYTEIPETLLFFKRYWFRSTEKWLPLTVVSHEVRQKYYFVKFEEFSDREQIQAIKGADIAVPQSDFPVLSNDEFYWFQLEGAEVHNLEGDSLGVLSRIANSGANPLFVVTDQKKERLIPAVDPILRSVDLVNFRITVDWQLDF
ncbi:MAG: ribosome maturation factor RimM [Burkholderiales bacterium]